MLSFRGECRSSSGKKMSQKCLFCGLYYKRSERRSNKYLFPLYLIMFCSNFKHCGGRTVLSVPNHNYHICCVELPFKGVCRNPPGQVSLTPCWWDPTRPKELFMAAYVTRMRWLCACVRWRSHLGAGVVCAHLTNSLFSTLFFVPTSLLLHALNTLFFFYWGTYLSVNQFYIPSKGKCSELDGNFSEVSSWKTAMDSRMVMPRPTLSPDSAGRINSRKMVQAIRVQGKIRLMT